MNAVRHRRKSNRLREADQVRRDCHAHFVTPTLKFPSDSNGGFDIAPRAITCHGKFHEGIDLPDMFRYSQNGRQCCRSLLLILCVTDSLRMTGTHVSPNSKTSIQLRPNEFRFMGCHT